jgi:sterol desaturase/sphingolipid hydroxylase (fatty acid hydroxylase superfamily)
VLLNAVAMFNHANLRLRQPVDRWLRRILVTPEMHRIHHSMEVAETNSNFGFNLPWWDRLCGTYRERARLPQESMAIGVKGLTGSDRAVRLTGLLALPFARAGSGDAIANTAESGHEAG